jgi:hypothetical protein
MGISRFYLPIRFIIGPGSLAQLGKETARLGKSALLVTGSKSMRSTGVLDKVDSDLKANSVNSIVFDRVEPNPRASTMMLEWLARAKNRRSHRQLAEDHGQPNGRLASVGSERLCLLWRKVYQDEAII